MMIIKDFQNLLPNTITADEHLSGMVLEVPGHGVPLLSKSVERLLQLARSGAKLVVFQPTLPVTSELGLGSVYPPLAYLYPQEFTQGGKSVLLDVQKKQRGQPSTLPTLTLVSDIDQDEQIHYFSTHYGKVVSPRYVRVVVGNTCNLKCVMCPYHSAAIKPTHTTNFFQHQQTMDWAIMERLAQDCGQARAGVTIGNVEEPLLHPRLIDFIRRCRQAGVPRVHLTTNGQLLNQDRSQALLEAGLTSIDISLDAADPETYFKIRGARLERVEANIMDLIEWRDRINSPCEIRTSFVRNQGLDSTEEQRFRDKWLAKINGVCVLNLAQYQDANMHLETGNQRVQNAIEVYTEKAGGRWACLFPFTEISVLPDGRIYYCIETLFRLGFDQDIASLGNYTTQSLQEIWQGELFQQLRQELILNQLADRPICKNCNTWQSQVVAQTSQNGLNVTTTQITEIYQLARDVNMGDN